MDYKQSETTFKLKTRNPHPAYVIYKGVCVCKQTYINKMGRNVELQLKEHDSIFNDLKSTKHLKVH